MPTSYRHSAGQSLIIVVGAASALLAVTGAAHQVTTPMVKSPFVAAQSYQTSLITQSSQDPGDTNWG
jgi:hypothetical protein